jgi:hypothetical protein
LRDIERLAGRDVGEIVDDDDAADDVDRRELAGERAANIARPKDRHRAHAHYSSKVLGPGSWGKEICRESVLVTGGTRGIGFAVAEALIKAGDKVAITGTTADGVVKAEHVLSANGSQVVGITCDVRDAGSSSARSRR